MGLTVLQGLPGTVETGETYTAQLEVKRVEGRVNIYDFDCKRSAPNRYLDLCTCVSSRNNWLGRLRTKIIEAGTGNVVHEEVFAPCTYQYVGADVYQVPPGGDAEGFPVPKSGSSREESFEFDITIPTGLEPGSYGVEYVIEIYDAELEYPIGEVEPVRWRTTGSITHDSFDIEKPEPVIEATALNMVPTTIVNEPVEVPVELRNTGDQPAQTQVTLTVNNSTVTTDTVSLTGGEVRTKTFTWTPTAIDTHLVCVSTEKGGEICETSQTFKRCTAEELLKLVDIDAPEPIEDVECLPFAAGGIISFFIGLEILDQLI